ncbi:MAG: GDP-mannose 4,6-dehydratase [Planctomycetes bacterium]|nr:GDP-mannose 4,6-dehydratase [Planctomycetota bacterium]
MRTILVTGGAGFIGSTFVARVFRDRPDWRILVLDALTYAGNLGNFEPGMRDHPRFSFWYGDVNNLTLVDKLVAQSDLVVHFAAESHVARSIADDRIFFQTDVMGTQAVANAVVNHQDRVERFVHISTSEVYGSAVREPMDEDHPLLPSSPYAAAKAGADRLVDSYVRTYDIPAVTVRPFNNYGPRQHLEKCVPRFVTSAILGEPLELHGGGGASRDWLYVEDCVDGILACLEAPVDRVRGQVVNLGTGVATSVADIADTVLSIAGRETPRVSVGERPGQVHRHIGDARRAHALLGWAPRTGLREGLERTYRWYEQNRAWWEPLRWMRRVRVRLPDGREELH